jgi:outer membrane protein assembly factor BamB
MDCWLSPSRMGSSFLPDVNDMNRFFSAPSILAFAIALVSSGCFGQDLEQRLARAGLEIVWQGQAVQPRIGQPPVSVVVYPHPTIRKQIVQVRIGDRIIETIHGDAVDEEAWEKKLLDASAVSIGKVGALGGTPKLGLAGAQRKAQAIADRLSSLGKKAVVDTPIDRQMIYLAVTNEDGTIQVFDAETGDRIWIANIGMPNLPTLPAGINDDYVAGINGSDLYLLRLTDGKILDKRHLKETPGGGSVTAGNRIFVTNIDGSMIGLNLIKREEYPWYARTGGFCQLPPVLSLDRNFIAWLAEPNYVFISRLGERPEIWSRFQTRDQIASNPTPVSSGYIITTLGGSIVRVGLPGPETTVTREDSMVWRYNSGSPIRQSAYAGGETVYVPYVDGRLMGLDMQTGYPKWDEPVIGVRSVVASTETKVFTVSLDQSLEIIDGATGRKLTSIRMPKGHFHSNVVNDRIYFFTDDGRMLCIREKGQIEPNFHLEKPTLKPKDERSTPKPTETPTESSSEANPSDPFGASPFDSGDSGSTPSADDPLGGADSAPSSEDPFGGG